MMRTWWVPALALSLLGCAMTTAGVTPAVGAIDGRWLMARGLVMTLQRTDGTVAGTVASAQPISYIGGPGLPTSYMGAPEPVMDLARVQGSVAADARLRLALRPGSDWVGPEVILDLVASGSLLVGSASYEWGGELHRQNTYLVREGEGMLVGWEAMPLRRWLRIMANVAVPIGSPGLLRAHEVKSDGASGSSLVGGAAIEAIPPAAVAPGDREVPVVVPGQHLITSPAGKLGSRGSWGLKVTMPCESTLVGAEVAAMEMALLSVRGLDASGQTVATRSIKTHGTRIADMVDPVSRQVGSVTYYSTDLDLRSERPIRTVIFETMPASASVRLLSLRYFKSDEPPYTEAGPMW